MTESQVGFLYNIAAAVSKSQNDVINTVLKSYYLMRCKDVTRGYGLPDKYFSSKIRCPNCCIEWKNYTEIKMRSIKLSKRQKKRLKSKKVKQNKKKVIRNRKNLLMSNELVQICSFCTNSTVSTVLKPSEKLPSTTARNNVSTITPNKHSVRPNKITTDHKNINPKTKKITVANVYSNAFDVFSLQNKSNILASTIKEKPKVITNNKKKKDKFAGLCQKAVLASATHKEQKKSSDALTLFLKPSST